MNRNQGPVSWISLTVLISLLLFKGVAAAAMLCCGPDHSAHSQSSAVNQHLMMDSSAAHNADHNADHSHHTTKTDTPTGAMTDSTDHLLTTDDHSSSCSGCAVSCAAAVLMLNPSDSMPEPPQNERFLSLTLLVFPLTSSGLERPPRFYS